MNFLEMNVFRNSLVSSCLYIDSSKDISNKGVSDFTHQLACEITSVLLNSK